MGKFKQKERKGPSKSVTENDAPKQISKRANRKAKRVSKRTKLLEKLTASRTPKPKPFGMSGLKECLNEIKHESKPAAPRLFGLRLGKKGVHSAIRKKLIENESLQLKHVLAHPEFKKNPLQAIRGLLTRQIQNDKQS